MTGESFAATGLEPLELRSVLSRERSRVEAALERAVEGLAERLPEGPASAVRYGVLSGGKRLRPILCAAAYRAGGGGDGDGIYDVAVSLELIHAYSLMHDDLPCMDDAELRRGRPTAHRIHGVTAAMNGGAILIPAAAVQAWTASRALGCREEASREIVATLCRAAGAAGMVGGQMLDLKAEGRRLSAEELDELHRMKTGALLAAAPRIGGLASNATEETLQGLSRYGRAVGLAFQITDDILDATSTAGELGKNPSDRELEKSTYVSLHGLEHAREQAESVRRRAREALSEAGLRAPLLAALADYAVRRRR